MIFKNTSRYPDDEVRRLVEFALRNLDHRGVAVHVKNSRYSVRGMVYPYVPYQSPLARRRKRKVKYLITIGIGGPEWFPRTARYARRSSDKGWPLVEHRDWREALIGVAAHEAQHIRQFQFRMPRSEVECERVEVKRIEEYRLENSAGRNPEDDKGE